MPRAEASTRGFRCLNCGYDLRAAEPARGYRLITCPECGEPNQASDLHHYGIQPRAILKLLTIEFGPALAMIASVWLFLRWTNVHAMLCLLLAPGVVPVHAYVVWQFVAAMVLVRRNKRRLQWGSVILAVTLDSAACVLVLWWLI